MVMTSRYDYLLIIMFFILFFYTALSVENNIKNKSKSNTLLQISAAGHYIAKHRLRH